MSTDKGNSLLGNTLLSKYSSGSLLGGGSSLQSSLLKSSNTSSLLSTPVKLSSTDSSSLGKHKTSTREPLAGKKRKDEKANVSASLKPSLGVGDLGGGTSSLLGRRPYSSSAMTNSLLGSSTTSRPLTGSSSLGSNQSKSSLLTSSLLTSSVGQSGLSSHSGLKLGVGSSSLQSTLKSTLTQGPSIELASSLISSNLPTTSKYGASGPSMTLGSGLSSQVKDNKSRDVPKAKKSSRKATTKSAQDKTAETLQLMAIKRYQITSPEYDLSKELPEGAEGMEIEKFLAVDKDPALCKIQKPLHDVNGMKLAFINAVSGSLICQPNFRDSKDQTRISLSGMAEGLVVFDPEFVLKVALYTRNHLNIRTTSNFILALAANVQPCRPYLKKYYCSSINLPTDWIEVAEIYQAFHDKTINQGSLPAALRRVMIEKFPAFDKYQLAKYNKESSRKKKKKVEGKNEGAARGGRGRGRGRGRGGRGTQGGMRGRSFGTDRGRGRGTRGGYGGGLEGRSASTNLMSDSSDSSDDEEAERLTRQISNVVYDEGETPEEISKTRFSLKQLIRKLHIVEPVEHVMSLIGKKYPDTLETFYQSRLPGQWEEERAGKRMKLPIPETWETQVSLKGNKASTWEELLDHKKLPFMAMLRNLRNLIKAGISQKHHNGVLRRLTDERQVVNSRQFPFRFFSAYEVLGQLEKEYQESQQKLVTEAENKAAGYTPAATRGRGRGRGGRGGKKNPEMWWLEKQRKKKEERNATKETPFDSQIINRYRKALDTSVKIATVYNVQPIKGRTIVLCDIGPSMEVPCTAARGLGKPRLMKEVAVLLGLMCKYSCEECDMVAFTPNSYYSVKLDKGTILDNMEKVLNPTEIEYQGQHETLPFGLPHTVLLEVLRDRIQVDNLIFLSGGQNVGIQQMFLSGFLKKYRELVNENLLYVNISFAGKGCGFSDSIKPEHDNDIYISGYSDQILRFIAEKGEGGQLMHVENIDNMFNLKPLPVSNLECRKKPERVAPQKPLAVPALTPRWRTVRVFISSTFRDMHGERDVLTRFVFPELRALAKKHFINVYEVDLRWGVTEEETRSHRTLELCLTEVQKCQLFLGILGERYGWRPDEYIVPNTEEFDWVKEYQKGASVTELEIFSAALCKSQDTQESAFFYFRNAEFENDVPKEFHLDFMCEDSVAKQKMTTLKNKIRESGLEVYDEYPCQWGGVIDHKPVVAGLELFASRVLNNLWNSIKKHYIEVNEVLDENSHMTSQHKALLDSHKARFVGRKTLIQNARKQIREMDKGLLGLIGKAGTGKSAFMAALVHSYIESRYCDSAATVLVHMVGAAQGSTNILATLRRLCHELKRQFGLTAQVPEDFKNAIQTFKEMLTEAATMCGSPLVLFIDGLDIMEAANQPSNLEWLPTPVPKNVVIVMTALEGGKCHKSLKRLKSAEMMIGGLDMWDKADIVRNNLAVHRKTLAEDPFNNQLKLLLSKKEATNPLFLQLACEELRVFGVFEQVTSKLKAIPHTVPHLLQEVLQRLEQDLGKETVQAAMSLLICTREGLDAEELHYLLSLNKVLSNKVTVDDVKNVQLTPDKMIPSVIFSQIKRSMETFLNPMDRWSSRLTLAHAEVSNAVRMRYLKGTAAEQEIRFHKLLAGYFYHLADVDKDDNFGGNSSRAFSELPYHLACSGEFKLLLSVLCSLNFINKKCLLGLGTGLLDDYQQRELSSKYLEKEQNKFLLSPRLQEYKFFVSRQIHILSRYPALTWQQALNEPSDSDPYKQVAASGMSDTQYMEWENKPECKDPNYLTLSNLPQPVTVVAISPGDEYFACGGLDCQVKLYEMSTGKELKTFRGHSNFISGLCFINKSLLCSSSHDNTISIWDVQDGHRVHILKSHNRRVQSVSANPEGKLVASASWDCTVRVWDTAKGNQVCDLKVGSPVNAVSFHPEGQLIVTGSWDSTIKIWDVFHKTRKAVLRGHKSSVRDVAYSPSGRHIASAALDGDVKIWAANNGTQVGSILGHSSPINKIIFSPTGKELITVSDDHKVKVWSGHLGKSLMTFGEEGGEAIDSIALSPDGTNVAMGYHSGSLKVHDTKTGFEMFEVKGLHSARIRGLTFSHDGKHIITGADDNIGKVVSVATGNKEAVTMNAHTRPVLCVTAVSTYVATGGEDCACCLYPASLISKSKQPAPLKALAVLHGHTGPVTSCTFSRDLQKLATASRDSSVMIWNIRMSLLDAGTKPLQVLNACHADWITGCQWSNVGDFLVTASNDFTIKVWDTNTGTEKTKMTGHMASISNAKYMYGCIVTSSTDGSVKVWSHKGTEITTLYGHQMAALSCDMHIQVSKEVAPEPETEMTSWSDVVEAEESAKGKKTKRSDFKIEKVIVATCSADGTAKLWKPLEANELANMTGHSNRVVSVASTVDGKLCTSSLDKAVKLWEPQLSTTTANQGHDAEVTFVEYHNLTSVIVSGSRDGVLKVWNAKERDSLPQCLFSIQAHMKSVNAACFLAGQTSWLVTGGDDAKIYLWEFIMKNHKIVGMKKVREFTVKTPVTTLCSLPSYKVRGSMFMSGEWSGQLCLWNTHENKSVYNSMDFGNNDWILKIRWMGQLGETNTKFYVTSANGCYSIGRVQVAQKIKVERVSKTATVVDEDVPHHKRAPNMLFDICGDDIKGYAASSKGMLIRVRPSMSSEMDHTMTHPVHTAPVTSIVETSKYYFTGSDDRTVKVWDKNLKQVGLFFCPAPVKALTASHQTEDKIKLACGDQLGNIHILTWRVQ